MTNKYTSVEHLKTHIANVIQQAAKENFSTKKEEINNHIGFVLGYAAAMDWNVGIVWLTEMNALMK